MPIRLILTDDHSIVLDGLRRLFESEPDFEVVATCADGASALDAVRNNPCDVLVLDFKMPGLSGLDVLRAIAAERLPCRPVLLTAAVTDDQVLQALQLGTRGVVLKESDPGALLDCVRRVYRGEQFVDSDTISRALGRVMLREAATHDEGKSLTPRELEIMRMVAQGLRNKVIADRLAITEGTVKIHLHNIYEKLDIDGRLELVLYAQEKGLA